MPLAQMLPPGIAGFEAARQSNRQEEAQGLARLAQMQGMAAKHQQLQREAQFRSELQALGPSPTQESLAQVAAKYGAPADLLKTQQSSLDRKAMMDARLADGRLRAQERLDQIREQAALGRITREEADTRAAGLRRDLMQMQIEGRADLARTVAGLREPRQEPAPTMAQIVDPSDPSRMLQIDARAYKGGSLGSSGVIGVAGREPAAAKREEAKEQGRRQISGIVDNLAASYDKLEKMGAVITPKESALSNIYERTAATGIGQTIAGFVGTKAQAVRDEIAASRPMLLTAIKQASGMSAQQLNSNVELQFYLAAATDPARSVESNRAALHWLNQAYGLGLGIRANPGDVKALRESAPRNPVQGVVRRAAPQGVDAAVWNAMTPEEQALWP